MKFFNNFQNRQPFWLCLVWDAVPGEKIDPYFTIFCCSFSMPVEEQFPKSCCCFSSYFIFCVVSQYADLLWLSVRLILRKREIVGLQSLKLFFLLLPFQANCSVSRILSQQATSSAVAQVFLLVCAPIEILPTNFMMLPLWISWPFQCHWAANCLMADLLFTVFFYSVQFIVFFVVVVDSGFNAPLLSATSSSNIWTCIFLMSFLKKQHFLLLKS